MKWIRIEEKKPVESDGLIIVSLKSKFKEIVYFDDKEQIFKKPFRYDKYDIPVTTMESIKYWFKLTEPILIDN